MKFTAINRRWLVRSLSVSALSLSLLTSPAQAGFCDWLTGKPKTPPTPYGPPIFTPNANPPIVGYGPVVPANGLPATAIPSTAPYGNAVPAASVAPSLSTPPPTQFAPSSVPSAYGANYCPTCPPVNAAPPRLVTNYVPPNYQTTWVQVPVTTYRPVVSTDPITGLPINAVQPCTTYQWQARRVPMGMFGSLLPAAAPPVATPGAVPVVAGYAPAAYAPQGYIGNVPVTTNYAPVVTNYAPPANNCCPSGTCPSSAAVVAPPVAAPYATFPSGQAPLATPPAAAPVIRAPAGATQPRTSFPASPPNSFPTSPSPTTTPSRPLGRAPEAADTAPRLVPGEFNPGEFNPGALVPSTRNYTPAEPADEALVPVPKVIDMPPPPSINDGQGSQPIRSPGFMPFGRTTDKPASSVKPDSKMRLVPDPDHQPLELRKHEIPSLISPDDQMTQRTRAAAPQAVPVAWPAKTIVSKPVVSAPRELPLTPASLPTEKLDDSGWKSVAR
ncbi:MAG TPA: hypothetical protein VL096_16275 [Pirellulaceae bacterium]|nr:hypothetical protein [Pirellulaceae bacterium]